MNRSIYLSWFLFIGMLLVAFWGIPYWLNRPKDQGLSKPLRKGFETNRLITKYLPVPKVVEYPKSMAAKKPRVNGKYGLRSKLDTANWKLVVEVPENEKPVEFDMHKIRNLPKSEVVFDFKCIEGWSQITWWGGCRFSDFVKFYFPQVLNSDGTLKFAFVGLVTPDHKYYVGIDSESMMHPKTLLCFEMNGQELPLDQGYPLRLIIPVKYGIKHLKRIGFIRFSNKRPKDYWAEKGYDFDAGL